MKKFKQLTALICLIAVKSWATTYYVTPSGNNNNNGKGETVANGNGPWASLTYAANNSVLLPGDIVYVKAGNYLSENVVFTKSGSAGSPISFIGYKTIPGDAPPVLVNTATAGTTFNTADMPTYTGWSRSSAGTAFDLTGQKYIVLKNFQITTYQVAVKAGGAVALNAGNITLDNVNALTLGSTSSTTLIGQAFQFGDMGYAVSNNNSITNCLAINSTYYGFNINGSSNTITGCKVFCNENITSLSSTDYYIVACGSSNTFNSCYAERTAGLTNTGAGIGVLTNATQIDQGLSVSPISSLSNTFKNCSVKNMGEGFFVRHRNAQSNLFYHCNAVGTHTGTGVAGEGTGIVIRDGASSNTFDGCKVDACADGIVFGDTSEDGDTGGSPAGHPGNSNKLINVIINNCYNGVNYSPVGVQSDAGDNTIANCTFYKTRYMHNAGRHCTKIKYIGNIYFGTSQSPVSGNFSGSTYASDIVPNGANTSFKQCDFIYLENFAASLPSYLAVNQNINADPLFVSTSNFHLTNVSPCIDKVDQITLLNNPKDYDNKPRYFGTKSDIGAYEGYTGNVYYVNTSGSNSNNGLAETTGSGNGPWATLTYAASATPNLQPGDVVYVKAASYGNENVIFAKSGTAGNPISFIGYKTTPGDAPPVLVTTATASTPFNSADMPTYTGTSRNVNIAFELRPRKYITIKNFQISTYERGVITGGAKVLNASNIILENVNVKTNGKTGVLDYSGTGIALGMMGTDYANNNKLINCLVINSAAAAFDINGNNNTITGCKAFCNYDVGTGSTDYYILVCGNKNTVSNCYVERLADIAHEGHGIGAKTNAEQVIDKGLAVDTIPADSNLFINCSAKNMGESFFVRHRKARYNKFDHCSAIGTHTGLDGNEGEGGGITIRDGASNNTFHAVTATNCANGITFVDTSEDGDTAKFTTPPGHPGNLNRVLNCIIQNCYIGVKFSDYGVQSDAGNNTIANCTFYKSRYLHYAGRHCANMKYIGNIYYGTTEAPHGGYFKGDTYASDIVPNSTNTSFKQCDFYNIEDFNGTELATYTAVNGNISSNPLFVSTSNLHLTGTSPCINKVDVLSYNTIDFDNLVRPNGVKAEIGAYEYYAAKVPDATTDVAESATGDNISIYPNPSNGILYINSGLDASAQIQVYNLMGQSVYKKAFTSAVDLSDLNSGIYLFQILSNKGDLIINKKINVNH